MYGGHKVLPYRCVPIVCDIRNAYILLVIKSYKSWFRQLKETQSQETFA